MKKFLLLIVFLTSFNLKAQPKEKWEGEIPRLVSDPALWIKFTDKMMSEGNYYGVLAASFRMILFFEDLESKKKAFSNLVKLIDIGYAHSLQNVFYIGDLDISSRDEFSQSYNFYKAVINKTKKLKKWSDDFFKRIDKENFKKYRLYQAINLYREKKLIESLEILDQILRGELSQNDFTFAKKVVRMKARILFERKEYEKSLELYDDFLLKVNPISPYDWLEKTWNLFYLKKYDLALGALYNLEAPSMKRFPTFEKYILRASIYLNNCRTDYVNQLVKNFEKEFNYSIKGIVNGKSLTRLPQLAELAKTIDPKYKKVIESIENLKAERKKIGKFEGEFRVIGDYLYKSELRMLIKYSAFFKEKALRKSAEELTMLAESLKFLGYSTAREKYNPTTVFLPREDETKSLIEVLDYDQKGFVFNWKQIGGFWQDERNIYYAEIENKCN